MHKIFKWILAKSNQTSECFIVSSVTNTGVKIHVKLNTHHDSQACITTFSSTNLAF